MQDRFKFRTYIPDLKFFKYWGWIDKNHYIGLCASGDTSMPELLEKYTEQCTGLKDKNGELIYEGDIVKNEFNINCVAQRHEKNDMDYGRIEFKMLNGHPKYPQIYIAEIAPTSEIIGNVYANPELLESEEK